MKASASDPPVLVVVINNPADLARVHDEGWYRIPVARAPQRIAAEYLAFYLTAAFPPEKRWRVHYIAPVRGYFLATRRELIPDEPRHPRSEERYYRVSLGPIEELPHPVPSLRLRRITFIPTTLQRLHSARELNDLWVRSRAHERLWRALQEADLEAEYQYPLGDTSVDGVLVADFALPCRDGTVVVMLDDADHTSAAVRERQVELEYHLAALGWPLVRISAAESGAQAATLFAHLHELCLGLGGLT